jgi:hypothetical protein
MEDLFFIPVVYRGAELQFEASLVRRGYTYGLHVNVRETIVVFERDEEGSWRALMPAEEKGKVPETELLQALVDAIEEIVK